MAEKDSRVGNVPQKPKARDRAFEKEVIIPPGEPMADSAYIRKRIGHTGD